MKFFLGFFISAVLLCFIAWLSGYNFDYRSMDVAFSFAMGVLLSLVAGMMAFVSDL